MKFTFLLSLLLLPLGAFVWEAITQRSDARSLTVEPGFDITTSDPVLFRSLLPKEGVFAMAPTTPGRTFYSIIGPSDSSCRLVFVHGIASPSVVFSAVAPLVANNFNCQVLRYDIYGRGFSDAIPFADNDLDLFVHQLEDLLKAVGWAQAPFGLLGYSMGGSIATSYAARHPEQVHFLILLSPLGVPQPVFSAWNPLRWPVVGGLLADSVGKTQLKETFALEWERALTGKTGEALEVIEYVRSFVDKQFSELPAFGRSVFSSIKNLQSFFIEDTMSLIGRHRTPTLLIWGVEDKTVPFALHHTWMDRIGAEAKLEAIEGQVFAQATQLNTAEPTFLIQGHMFPLSDPERTSSVIGTFAKAYTSVAQE